MYKCKPERSVKQVRIIVWGGFLLIALLFLASASFLKQIGGYLNLLGFAAICVEIMLLVRFVLSEYEYTVDGENFTVTRITGKKRTDMCCVSLATAIKVMPKKEYAELPAAEKAIVKYAMNQNIKAESKVFLFEFNGKRAMVEFEPNEAFAAIVQNQIDEAKKRAEEQKNGNRSIDNDMPG